MRMRQIASMVAVIITLLAVSTGRADTIFVDAANCPGPGDGSIGNPYCSIQTAIDNAVDTDEIVVAPGTYLEAINFIGKAIWVHSSDGPKVTIIDATSLGYNVVNCYSGEGPDTVLSGFVITGGDTHVGGGMFNSGSSPTVTNCTFSNNAADVFGGGMYNTGYSNPTVTNCTFSGNTASFEGGGMYNGDSSPTVTDCTFSANSAENGGGMNNIFSSPTVTNCMFTANTADSGGGMASGTSSNPTVTNCTFGGNTAESGGGIYNNGSSPTVTNCSFSQNSANFGGGMYNDGSSPFMANCCFHANVAIEGNTGAGGAMLNAAGSNPVLINCTLTGNETFVGVIQTGGGLHNHDSNPTITNCILWNNTPCEVVDDGAAVTTVRFSDVRSGWPGPSNIDADPQFVDPDNGDSRLSPGSPCIDAGHNWGVPPDTADLDDDADIRELTPLDLDGNPRFADDPATQDTGCGVPIPIAVDMGAYEFPGTAASNPIYLGDLDADRVVGIVDFLTLLANWGAADMCLPADLDFDGDVGITDFLILLGNWG